MSRTISRGAFSSFSTTRSTGKSSVLAKSVTTLHAFFPLQPAADNQARHALADLMDNEIRIAKAGFDAFEPGTLWGGVDWRTWSEYSPASWVVLWFLLLLAK